MGGRALLASDILLREGAPKAWAKEGRDWGGWVAMRSLCAVRGGGGEGRGTAHALVGRGREKGARLAHPATRSVGDQSGWLLIKQEQRHPRTSPDVLQLPRRGPVESQPGRRAARPRPRCRRGAALPQLSLAPTSTSPPRGSRASGCRRTQTVTRSSVSSPVALRACFRPTRSAQAMPRTWAASGSIAGALHRDPLCIVFAGPGLPGPPPRLTAFAPVGPNRSQQRNRFGSITPDTPAPRNNPHPRGFPRTTVSALVSTMPERLLSQPPSLPTRTVRRRHTRIIRSPAAATGYTSTRPPEPSAGQRSLEGPRFSSLSIAIARSSP